MSLRAHLLHDAIYASLALVDVVAVAPWGSEFFRLVRDNAEVFAALPPAVHEGAARAYVDGASHIGLTLDQSDMLVTPWLGDRGHALAEAIPAAQFEVIEDAGHLVQLDQPVRLATRLHRWLAER